MILYSSLNIIHKTIHNKKPPGLLSYFKINNKARKVKKVATSYIPLSTKLNNFYIYKYLKIYNSIDQDILKKSVKGFKNEIKLSIRAGTINDSMD